MWSWSHLAHEGNNGVGGVGDDSADDAGGVTRHESDAELCALGVAVLGLREDMRVEGRNHLLEKVELGLQVA